MSLFLKLFDTTAEYNAYTADTENFILPNVSCTMDDLTKAHYNPYVPPETRVIATYNVTSTSSPTPIGYNQYTSGFSVIEIDGVVQPSVVSAYTFSTTGVHTVKYTLTDPTSIGSSAFKSCTKLKSIDIPNSVTSIGSGAFDSCSGLTICTIDSSVTSIGSSAFKGCTRLKSIDIPSGVTSITSNATTAPTILNATFQNVHTGGTLKVPSGSSGYDTWMQNTNYYLGLYGWTKVEQ